MRNSIILYTNFSNLISICDINLIWTGETGMTTLSHKGSSTGASYPRTLSWIMVLVCVLAAFLVVFSMLFVSRPVVGSAVRGYFYEINHLNSMDTQSFSSWYITSERKKQPDDGGQKPTGSVNATKGVENDVSSCPIPGVSKDNHSMDSGCDLFNGEWVYDPTGPLYSNSSCPILTQMQNCRGNGRPDTDYENWRWKPAKCDLPRFDAKYFLELMRGKTVAFVGDSVARNQMESLMCILWQVEVPKNRGNRRMQRYYFRSTSTMIIRIWSSWLVHETTQAFDFAPEGVTKIHLDLPDETFLNYVPDFDVVVLSSGHWFAKQSVYILENKIVGGQLWWPDKSRLMKVNNIEAFKISTETILTAMVTHPNYTGLTIVRSFSPDHYEGGAWNTGGSCVGKVRPALDHELAQNEFTNIMHKNQVDNFRKAIMKAKDKSKLKFMDITRIFEYRHDGHPGPYRSQDPNKVTKRGPDGRPPPQDCLHWCMPGPIDTWNEMAFEIIKRNFQNR